eukprot:11732054-Ditylum_brightwellii.AAC.2
MQLPYEFMLEFYGEIDPSTSRIHVSSRCVKIHVGKTQTGPHWPRLRRQHGKAPPWLKIDWNLWKDEDEEAAEANRT